jgi:hypothetical protein
MAEKKVKVKIDVETNAEGSIAQLKELKRQLKEVAAGSDDFKRISKEIKNVEDALEEAKSGAKSFVDQLEEAPGPIGQIAGAFRKLEIATKSFGAAFKAIGIGLIVSLVAGLAAALSKSEDTMKKFEPILIMFEQLLNGILGALQPLIDGFIELALNVMPYVTQAFKVVYSAVTAVFQSLGKLGGAIVKLFKGDFKGAWEDAKASVTSFSDNYDTAVTRFEAGQKKMTKTQKENLDQQAKDREEAKKKREEELKELAAGQEEAMKTLMAEQEKEIYETQKKYANLIYLATKYGEDTKSLKDAQAKELAAIDKKYADEELKKKEEKDKKDKEIADKKAEDERGIKATGLQAAFEDLDRKNKLADADFAQDLERIKGQRDILAEQEKNDLSNTNLTEFQRTEIRKKYADQRIALTDLEIATERAATQAKAEINMAYLGLFEQFGNLLGQIAGKNKALAIAGIVISQAASIGQIVANTGIANAKAVAASPLTFGAPWVLINTISAGLSIASTIASAVKSIQQINSAASSAGVTGGGGGGSVGSAPTIPTPKVGGTTAPEIQTGQGINPSTQIAQSINRAQAPLKAYVVSGEVSSQMALDRRTSRAATFVGG